MADVWDRLRDFAVARIRAKYMRHAHHDRRCPLCNTWISEVGGAAEARDDTDARYELMRCNRCSMWSRWDMAFGPVVILADDQPQKRWEPANG